MQQSAVRLLRQPANSGIHGVRRQHGDLATLLRAVSKIQQPVAKRWQSNLPKNAIPNMDSRLQGLKSMPSSIPREDYATPAMYSFGIFARKW